MFCLIVIIFRNCPLHHHHHHHLKSVSPTPSMRHQTSKYAGTGFWNQYFDLNIKYFILIFIHVFQVEDDFLIALATEQSQIESLAFSCCVFTDDGLQYLRKVTGFIHRCSNDEK